jgi:phosphatidylglycerophosphate synthase
MDAAGQGVRRDVRARGTGWARAIAGALARAGVRPNTISLLSVLFAFGAGLCLTRVSGAAGGDRAVWLVSAVVLIQLRLLCNLFDGMVAVEGGAKTKSGEIFNDLPDRVSDPVILVCAGYAVRELPLGIELGWLAGLLAVLTAYVRTLAGASGAPQRFLGPMAKQHRMAVLSVALLVGVAARPWVGDTHAIGVGLLSIVTGSCITVWRRAVAAVDDLEQA